MHYVNSHYRFLYSFSSSFIDSETVLDSGTVLLMMYSGKRERRPNVTSGAHREKTDTNDEDRHAATTVATKKKRKVISSKPDNESTEIMDDDPLEAANTLLQLHEPRAAPVLAETCTDSPDDPSKKSDVAPFRYGDDPSDDLSSNEDDKVDKLPLLTDVLPNAAPTPYDPTANTNESNTLLSPLDNPTDNAGNVDDDGPIKSTGDHEEAMGVVPNIA